MLDIAVKTLVRGGAVIGILAVIEARTGFAPFPQLNTVFPFLKPDPSFTTELERGSATRAVGPAEHPIALGAALVMLVPLAIYVSRERGRAWYFAARRARHRRALDRLAHRRPDAS